MLELLYRGLQAGVFIVGVLTPITFIILSLVTIGKYQQEERKIKVKDILDTKEEAVEDPETTDDYRFIASTIVRPPEVIECPYCASMKKDRPS